MRLHFTLSSVCVIINAPIYMEIHYQIAERRKKEIYIINVGENKLTYCVLPMRVENPHPWAICSNYPLGGSMYWCLLLT